MRTGHGGPSQFNEDPKLESSQIQPIHCRQGAFRAVTAVSTGQGSPVRLCCVLFVLSFECVCTELPVSRHLIRVCKFARLCSRVLSLCCCCCWNLHCRPYQRKEYLGAADRIGCMASCSQPPSPPIGPLGNPGDWRRSNWPDRVHWTHAARPTSLAVMAKSLLLEVQQQLQQQGQIKSGRIVCRLPPREILSYFFSLHGTSNPVEWACQPSTTFILLRVGNFTGRLHHTS